MTISQNYNITLWALNWCYKVRGHQTIGRLYVRKFSAITRGDKIGEAYLKKAMHLWIVVK
jgi:hypothetical protein